MLHRHIPKLVIVNGMPGSGKTTFITRLKDEIDIPLLSKDDVKEFLFKKLGTHRTDDWSRMLGKVSSETLRFVITEMVEIAQPLLVESAFHYEIAHKYLNALIQEKDLDLLEVYVQVDQDVAIERIRRRWESGLRHPGHRDEEFLSNPQANFGVYKPLELSNVIYYDSMNPTENDFTSIINKINEFLGGTRG